MKRYPIYEARIASSGRLIGAVALPMIVIAVLAHRGNYLGLFEMLAAIGVAACLALIAIVLCIAGLVVIWREGGTGIGRALAGLTYGALAFLPALAFVLAPRFLDQSPDVSTSLSDPPEIVRGATVLWPPMLVAHLGLNADQRKEFPDIVSRRYRLTPMDLHAAVREVVARNGWTLTAETPPDLPDAPTRLQMEVRTPFLRLVEDVAFRIRPDRVGALLDIRAASRVSLPDLTGNAERIRDLFRQIDEVLLETYGEIASEPVLEAEGSEPQNDAAPNMGDVDLLVPPGGAGGGIRIPGFKPYIHDGTGDTAPADGPLDDRAGTTQAVPR
ncbi:DUF1499 domain-containing protein [Roseibium litorale]|uniref:DUF1499 domain-containing protein n=1 Tax=Roseibium litorale TaxID=2803841 RepID=A0ABR9CS71_9HYPH|nr:DUF1499 domain-containing protein [Roseibium litorale]MBD8893127.1 DUF1499 domain-containing protein [Roseibium litorale]